MDSLSCPICHKQYSQINPPRLLTMCGHTFCHQCVKTLIKKKDHKFHIRCPEDKMTMILDTASPAHFPRNMALLAALQKTKLKNEPQDKNEFLVEEGSRKKLGNRPSTLGSLLKPAHSCLEEGMCLLHRKPLDIVCLEEKMYICAECALFGLHKGRSFSTIRDLLTQKQQWLQAISTTTQQKKQLQMKLINGQFDKQLNTLVDRKKQILLEELSSHFALIRKFLDQKETKLREELQLAMDKLGLKLKFEMMIEPQLAQQLCQWQRKAEQGVQLLQSDDPINIISVMIKVENKQNLISQGKKLLSIMQENTLSFWNRMEDSLQYPKVRPHESLQDQIETLVSLQLGLKPSQQLQMTCPGGHQSVIGQDISLLDMSSGFTFLDNSQFSNPPISIKVESPVSVIVQPNSHLGSLIKSSDNSKPNRTQKTFASKKQKGDLSLSQSSFSLSINQLGLNSPASRMPFKSPTHMLRANERGSKNVICSASPFKAKWRKACLRVRQPQKFCQAMDALQGGSPQALDLTGMDIGDAIAAQILPLIEQSVSLKNLRLMKNQLSDQSAATIVRMLKKVNVLNLSHNNFTDKIIEAIALGVKANQIEQGKAVQLGNNRISSRGSKLRIQELKKLNVHITI